MHWPFAHVAKVVRRCDDTCAEMKLPKSIGQHARRQRVVGGNDPSCQRLAPLTLRRVGSARVSLCNLRQSGPTRGHYHLAFSLRIATLKYMLRLAPVFEVTNGRHRFTRL